MKVNSSTAVIDRTTATWMRPASFMPIQLISSATTMVIAAMMIRAVSPSPRAEVR
ncbi:hypothetical protein D1872_327530 [compost metagenome]